MLTSVSFLAALAPGGVLAQSALPTGGMVASGAASIATGRNSVIVTQSSPNAIINWSSFSVGSGNSVRFENGAGATLNRVTGFSASQIDGSLSASGSLFLVNPNGVVVGPTGMVTTGGSFVASTHDVTDGDFNASGAMRFRGASTAGVVNYGVITSLGGDVALIARKVENAGSITAPNGVVGLAAGYEVLLRDAALSDGKLLVKVGGADTEAKTSGVIKAAEVELRANGGNVYALAGNTRSLTKATGVATKGGRVFLTAGDNGAVDVRQRVVAQRAPAAGKARGGDIRVSGGAVRLSGALKAKGKGDSGGTIVVSGADIALAGTARLDASGASGGAILVGGDWQGGADVARKILPETVATAQVVTVESGATLDASGAAGAGGKVVVWSDRLTTFAGAITATGAGAFAGGDAEVSGKARLAYSGTADLRSATGRFGTLLLDPYNLTISSAPSSGMSGFDAGADSSVLNVTTLTDALATANVTVTTGSAGVNELGHITVAAPLAWSSNSILTLSAAGNIVFSAPVTATGASAGLVIEYGTGKNYTVAAPITLSGLSASLYIGATGALQPYALIRTIGELMSVNNGLSGKHALAQDIVIPAGVVYTDSLIAPVSTSPFTGTFAGLGHTVSGVTISRSAPASTATGFFGFVGLATIRDFGLIDPSITVTGATVTHYAGTLIGRATSTTASISNVYAGGANGSVSVTATTTGVGINVGGLIGGLGPSITNVYSTASVSYSSTVTSYGGGLVGVAGTASITNAYATGSVTGVSVGNAYVGGLVGWSQGNITRAYATGALSTQTTGSGYTYAGGLVGRNTSSSKSYTDVYSSSPISGSSPTPSNVMKGGLIADNSAATFTVTRAFWDQTTSGVMAAVGLGTAPQTGAFVGLTTTAARTQAGYTGFDFTSNWYQAGDMRPILRWELAAAGGYGWISNLNQLQLANANLSGTYALANSINAAATAGTYAAGVWGATGFQPLGASAATPFTGQFDGRGYSLSGVTIAQGSASSVGLFGATSNASIQNVILSSGSITGASNVGSLIGSMLGGSVTSVSSSASVTGNSTSETNVGGLIGQVDGGAVARSSASGAVTGAGYQAGGLVGYLINGGVISTSFATGAVTGTSATYGYIGGLAGANGYSGNGGTISQSYATGNVTGAAGPIGGFVGHNEGAISNSYATGQVTGTGAAQNIGGFVGVNFVSGTISASYSIGQVSGGTQIGGFAGYNNNASAGAISSAFWNVETSGQSLGASGAASGVTGLTTAQFQNTSFFMTSAGAAWNFDTVWAPPSSGYYPQLYALTPVVWAKSTASWVYGATSAPVTVSMQGGPGAYVFAAAGDTLTLPGKTASVDPTTPVGTSTALGTIDSGTVTSTAGTSYRVLWYGASAPTITPATLTVTAGNGSMQYGDAVPAIGYAATGWKNGQSDALLSGVTVGTDATSTSNVGTSYTTTASGGTLSGTATGNYTLSYASGAFSVTPRLITVTADAQTRVYGEANPALTYTIGGGGLVNGDTLIGALSTTANAASNVTGYAISIGTLTASSNYTITGFTGATLNVTPAPLTVTAGNGSMVYGDAVPAIGYSASGWKNGQSDVLLSGVTVGANATSTSNVGSSYTTTASGGVLSGAANGNYTLTHVDGSFSITPAALTVTAANGSMQYGDAVPTLGYSASGWKNGQSDALLSGVTVGTNATSTSNVGLSYTTTASGGALSGAATGNYTLTHVDGAFSITPAPLTVTAANGSMVYGDAVPTLGYSTTGWKNGQSDALLSGVTVGTNATSTSNVGTSYTTTASGGVLSGAANGNYTLTHVDGSFSITPAALTVIAANGSMVYGDAVPAIGYTATGWKNGQTDALLSGVTVATNATSTSNVGTAYTTTASGGTLSGAANGNYTLSHVDGAFSITPAALTVTAANGSMVYGDSVPTLGYSASGWKNGQTDALLSGVTVGANATSTSNVGTTYTTTASGGVLSGAANGNYTLAHVDGAFSITPAALTVTAGSARIASGNAVPPLGYTSSGWKNGQSDALLTDVIVSTTATSNSPADVYLTIARGGALSGPASGNYALFYLEGQVVITQAATAVPLVVNPNLTQNNVINQTVFSTTSYSGSQSGGATPNLDTRSLIDGVPRPGDGAWLDQFLDEIAAALGVDRSRISMQQIGR